VERKLPVLPVFNLKDATECRDRALECFKNAERWRNNREFWRELGLMWLRLALDYEARRALWSIVKDVKRN